MPKITVKGFTLLELMIALVVLGILAAIAFPSYVESVRKGRRSDAVAALQRVQQAQERFRANNTRYTNDLSALGVGSTSSDGYYTIAVSGASDIGYTATATVVGGTPQAGDTRCNVLRLVQTRGNTSYGSTDANAADAEGAHNVCWNR
jgi:type IV pilus assembly protein PilE